MMSCSINSIQMLKSKAFNIITRVRDRSKRFNISTRRSDELKISAGYDRLNF